MQVLLELLEMQVLLEMTDCPRCPKMRESRNIAVQRETKLL
jgi:hypothetical protein